MTVRFLRYRTLGLLGSCALLAASCSLLHAPGSDHASATRVSAPAQLVQLDFGHKAMFARCIPPACPTRTPKTLAPETPSPPIDRAVLPASAEPVAPDPVAPNPLPKTETSRTVTVQFAFGSTWLSPTAQSRLEAAIADIATAHSVTISGRTDSTGPLAVNEALALARAHAVRNYLLNKHPALTAALTVQAQGACCFIASNDTLTGRAMNRRVEVVFHMTEEDQP